VSGVLVTTTSTSRASARYSRARRRLMSKLVGKTARALGALVRDPARRAALGAAARARVRAEFTWDHIARRYLSLMARA
jgi:hypothetical protein